MTKQERFNRSITLCLVVLGLLLWSNTINVAFGSVPGSKSVAKSNQKPTAKSGVMVEEFTFQINDFKIDHQTEHINLNITISYRYKANLPNADYPDFMLIARDIENLLTNYPNEEDYWEIVNKRITLMILEKYPTIAKVTSQMQVSPTPKNKYVRSTIVTRDRTAAKRR